MAYSDIKKRIYNDNKIEYILANLGCSNIHTEQNGNLWVSALPDGDNKRSVQIKNNDNLSSSIRSRGIKGDIFHIVSYIKNLSMSESKEWVMNLCDYKFNSFTLLETSHPLDWLRSIRSKRKPEKTILKPDLIDEKILDNYIDNILPLYNFYIDGIGLKTQKYFGIKFDPLHNRIIIPIRNLKGELIGVKGRNLDKYEINNDRKYIFVYPTLQSLVLFNYHRAIAHIQENGFVIVGESEKLPMQLHEMKIYNAVSLGCSDASSQQIKLLKNMKCDIVLAYDKGIDLEKIKEKYGKLAMFRNIYAINDSENILKDKESPTDRGYETWKHLFDNKIKLF